MNFVVIGLNILFLASVLFLLRQRQELRLIYWLAAIAKIVAGIAVGLIYFHHYHVGDTIAFAIDAKKLASVGRHDLIRYTEFLVDETSDAPLLTSLVLQDYRSLLMTKITSVFSLLSNDNYWIMAGYCSVCSLFGFIYFLKSIHRTLPALLPAAALAVFFPSVVFWSSGLIKESLAIGGLFFLSGLFIRIWCSVRIGLADVLVALLASWLTWKLKYYYAGVFFIVAVPFLLYQRLLRRRLETRPFAMKITVLLLLVMVPLAVGFNAHPNFRPKRILSVVVENYNAFQSFSDPESVVRYDGLSANISSLAANAPKAIICGLYRPFFWESTNLFQLLSSLENLMVFLLTIAALFGLHRSIVSSDRLLLLAVLAYVTVLCVFIALSTPNFGTLSRYRVSYLPFFLMLVLSASPLRSVVEKTYHWIVRNK